MKKIRNNNSEYINKKEQKKQTSSLAKDIGLVLFFSLIAVNNATSKIAEYQWEIKDILDNNTLEIKDRLYEQKLLKIVNFDNLSDREKNKALQDIIYREQRLDALNVPKHMRVPLEAICITENKNQVNIITKFRNIHYFPSISLAYQLSEINYEYFLKYGKDAPTLSIICGLLSQETGIRDIINPEWDSKGYGQLHYPTAKDLLDRKPEIYSQYFYLKDGHIEFHGNTQEEREKNMLIVIYRILIEEKNYQKGNELLGLGRYNGSQKNLDRYAIPVVNKAISYATFFAAMNNNIFTYDQEIQPIEYLLLEEGKKLGKQISPKIIRDIFNNQVTTTRLWRKDHKNYKKYSKMTIENSDIQLLYGSFSYISTNQEVLGEPYIIPEKGKTIFSYFRENTWEATEYHNSKVNDPKEKIEIFCYELVNNKKVKYIITSKQEMIRKYNEWRMIYASPDKKKIYINPIYNLYYYEGQENRVTTIYFDNINTSNTNITKSDNQYYSTSTY